MRGWKRIVLVLIVAGVGWAGQKYGWFKGDAAKTTTTERTPEPTPAPQPRTQPKTATGASEIDKAFRAKRSGVWLEEEGTVVKLLRDDMKGSKHQQWLLRLESGLTVKFAHNIDLAPYLKTLAEGDRIQFRGRYEYNIKGGVVHWTHHDPQGRQEGGWIDHDGKRYK